MIKLNAMTRRRIAGLGLGAALVLAPGLVLAQSDTEAASQTASAAETKTAETVIQKWPKKVQTEARMLIDRYGQPTMVDENQLMWTDNGPWRKTVLHKEGLTRSMMGRSRDHLEQVISRQVPEDKVADLEKFDKRIKVDRAAGEISSRSDSERMNFLTLNLADDIVKGQRSVSDAKAFSAKVKSLEKAGKASPYLDGFIFAKEDSMQGESGAAEDSGMRDESGVRQPQSQPETRPEAAPESGSEMERESNEGRRTPENVPNR